jgi:hypothetical protein
MFKKIILAAFLLIIIHANVQSQSNASREDLQKEEQSIRKELDELNQLLEQTKKNKKLKYS